MSKSQLKRLATQKAAPAPATDEIMALADTMAQRLADYLHSLGDGGDVRTEYTNARAALRAAVEQIVRHADDMYRLAQRNADDMAKQAQRAERAELQLTAAHQLQREHTEQILRLSGERDFLYRHTGQDAAYDSMKAERDEVLALLLELDKRLDDERSAEDRQLRWRIYELVKGDLNHSLGYATVWHDGSKSFYHAQLIRPMTAEEVQREAEGG